MFTASPSVVGRQRPVIGRQSRDKGSQGHGRPSPRRLSLRGCSPDGESRFLSHRAPVSSLGRPAANARQSPLSHGGLAQALAGSRAPETPGKQGAPMGQPRPGVLRGGQPEPQEGVRWICGQRKSPTPSP